MSKSQKFIQKANFKKAISFFLLLLPCVIFGQFTYIGAGISNTKTVFEKGNLGGANGTFVRAYNFDLNLIVRVKRSVGLGLNLSLPISQKSGVRFDDGNRIINDAGDFETRYRPSTFRHSIEETATSTLYARLFFAENPSFYVDFRFSRYSIQESLQINRSYLAATYYFDGDVENPRVDEIIISENYQQDVFLPGISFGFMWQNENNFFYNMFLTADFASFKSENNYFHFVSYRRTIGAGLTNASDSQIISRKAVGGKSRLSTGISLGYFF